MTVTVNLKNITLPGLPAHNTVSGKVMLLPERFFLWEDGSEPAEIIQAELIDDQTGTPISGILSQEAYQALLAAAELEALDTCSGITPDTELPF